MPHPPKICPLCERAIPSYSPGGNCPACLFKKPPHQKEVEVQASTLPEIPRFHLHELIGEGGFGLVYRATQHEPVQREVALKVLKPGLHDAQVLARFEVERQALALMDHPNIARIYDAGQTADQRPFFAMELVEGQPLNTYCKDKLPDLPSRLSLFLDACSAVTHAHQKGLIHRDLKPSNILVGSSLKVIDFGIAKATEHILTENTMLTGESQLLGTPEYMSPEQADGGSLNVDTRADVYSLGAVLYELIAGAPPFTGEQLRAEGFAEILRIIREQDPPLPSTHLSGKSQATNLEHPKTEIKNDLDWIVMQALEKDRDRRYETVSALADDIRHFLAFEPVAARPPSTTYRLLKFIRKNRTATVAAALVLFSIISAAIVSTSMAIKAKNALTAEAAERTRADLAALETRQAYSNSDLLIAENHLHQNEPGNAVAHLARALRTNPTNESATAELLTILSQTSFPKPTRPAAFLKHRPTLLAHHPTNHHFLTVTARGQAILANSATGKIITEIQLTSDHFTPSKTNPNLTHLALGTTKGLINLYALPSGNLEASFQIPNPILLRDLALSPTGTTVFSASHDGKVRAWSATHDLPIWTFTHHERVTSLDVSADGSRLAAGFGDGLVAILDTSTGKAIAKKKCHANIVNQIKFLHTLDRIATASSDHTARVWSAQDLSSRCPPLRHNGPIYHLAVSPCFGRLATSSYDQSTRVWDSFSGAMHGRPLLHHDHVYFSSFSPDGSRLATASRDRTVRLWDPYRGVEISAPIHHTEAAIHALFTPDGHHLLTTSRDRDLSHWNITPRAAQPQIITHDHSVPLALFDAEEPTLLTLSQGEKARLFDLTTGRQNGFAIPIPGHFRLSPSRLNPRFADQFTTSKARSLLAKNTLPLFAAIDRQKVNSVALDPSLERLLIGHTDGTLVLWDLQTARQIHRTQLPLSEITCLDLEGHHALIGHADGTIHLLNPHNGKTLHTCRQTDRITSTVLDVTHQQFATGSANNSARIWSLKSGEAITPPLAHTDTVAPIGIICRFSPDGSLLATGGSHDTTLRLWSTTDGKPHCRPLKHADYLSTFTFSHDGQKIATGTPTHDQVADVHLWHVPTGKSLGTPFHHPETLVWLQFSNDDQLLVSSSLDGTVKVTATPTLTGDSSLPALAEFLAHRSLDKRNSFESPPFQPSPPTSSSNPWLQWLTTPPEQRGMAPTFDPKVSPPPPARSFSAYRKALLESPMNPSLIRSLSKSLTTSNWPRHQLEAEFYRKLAATLEQK